MKITRLRTLHMDNPLGVDVNPYFSWIMESDRQNVFQDSYRIVVTTESGEIVWDTGQIKSDTSIYIPYEGKTLLSREPYKVSVWVKDNYGEEACAEGTFEMGLLSAGDWKAQWVESPIRRKKAKKGFGKQDPATMFRKSFILRAKPVRARCYATCHGIYRMTVNGKRADNREFAPEHTVYEKYLCYQVYDITELLCEGENVLGMYVGDGWYLGARSLPDMKKMRHAHAVLFQLELLYEDGTREVIGSDGTVKVSYGPVQSSDLFDGELYDATKERQNWDCPGYSDTDWKSVKAVTYTMSNLRAQLGPPVTEVMTIPAKKVIHSPKGETIIDFGQTIAGRVRMKITAPKGTEVTLEHCEVLDKEGNYYNNIMSTSGGSDGCQQKDVYIADGTIAEYEPLFTFHGFRYVKITGLENIRKEDFTAVVLSSEQENTGTFESSDVRLNRLYENTRWSQRSNMLSIPTDCPQREKAGWTGDIQIYASTALQNADLTAFLTRWLYNVSCDQGQYGEVPIVVPYDGPYSFMGKFIFRSPGKNSKSTSAGWGDAAVLVPYQMYQITGNTEILKQQYNSMKKWCDYIIGQIENKKGKKKKLPEETGQYLWNTGFHFGEWLIPSLSTEGMGNNKGMQISLKETTKYTAPVFGWLSVCRFAEIARLLGRTADAQRYDMAGNKMKEAISDEIIRSGGKMPAEWMGAYVLAIYFDLVPEPFKEYFASHLPELIEKNDGCLDTGFLATPYILDALCKIGRQDMAYELLWNEKQPSWMFEVEHGATTIWESWFAYNKDGAPTSVSMNHYAFGCVDDWIFRTVNGLDKEKAGFKKICICPKPDGRLTYAKRSFCSEYGTIVCNWEKKEEEFFLHVEIPCNTTATIVLPNGDTCETGSGKYEFACRWNP